MPDKIIAHSKPTLGREEELAVSEVVRSGHITQGRKVESFEFMMASYVGRKYAVAVSSGLAALHLSLIALKVKEGDEVLLPSYTCEALMDAVLYLNARPKIVDVEYATGNISPEEMRKSITPGTSAAIVPHSFGFPGQMDKIVNLGIPVVEDCATSIGARYRGQPVGSFSLISAYSFYATKMLTTGEGGMIITDDWDVAQLVRELRDYTGRPDFRIRYNYKMTDISAALGIAQLKKLDEFITRRTALAAQYTGLLSGHSSVILPEYDRSEGEPNFYRYLVKLPAGDAEKIRLAMKEKGIICGKAVLHPLHRLLKLSEISYPNCEKLANEVISLPIYPLLTSGEVTFICHEFLRILESKR